MEDCFTQPRPSARGALPASSVATSTPRTTMPKGPKESTLAALRGFARAYRAVALSSMPEAPGMVLN
jgi:hypothetical protein